MKLAEIRDKAFAMPLTILLIQTATARARKSRIFHITVAADAR
jgi:hypothetical protein